MDQDLKTREPLVSVLLPVYNGEKYLKDCINSVLNQTYSNFEFVIIDDGSVDSTESIISSYNDSRIRFIKNQQNLKLIATLNKGIKLSEGKYIARIDADDLMHPNRLQKQVDFLETNVDYVFVGSAVRLIKEEVEEESIRYYTEHDDIVFSMLFYCPFIHPSLLLRKSIINENELYFDSDFLHAEDYELWTRIVTFGKVANLPEKLTSYRIHHDQISQQHIDYQKKQMQLIRNNFLNKRLTDFSDLEKDILFGNQSISRLTQFLNLLNKFELDNSFQGGAKIRYIYNSAKTKILTIDTIGLKDFLFVLTNKYFWKNNFTFKQKVAFFLKIFKC